ncbi:DUF2125 domain-containing protein [Rhodopseudomonas sp. P2A-2r]|uniref:DUF2125 domain-containing protein n=1 Tax=Rhodopseudomonas sp. P2A-2r TaxID=2991972 RepID=UPI002233F784|nr:DUF2125 domain-containing protein [Rhodopseudomonas sp. P2A-2r]UZE50216.1 DUF2125 domain-containing protein [Rhodopseudomonas sp. P2A-2r]
MSDFVLPTRRRRLWPVFIMPILVVVLAAAWSAFWFYAASKVDENVDAWRAREAAAGRTYDCADRSVAGFPFRLEVRCTGVSVALLAQTAGQAAAQPINAKLGEILVVAQIYDPKLLIAEFKAPAVLSDRGQPAMVVNWSTARSSIVGLPGPPDRADIVFDDASVDRIAASVQAPIARAKHIELHGRNAESSTPDKPVIEAALQIGGGSIQDLHPLLAVPFDADIRAQLSGLKDFSPKPWPARFRELQAAGGRVEIVQSRIQQGDLISVASGSLGLTAAGNLDGEVQMTVAGLEKVIPALGIDKLLEMGVPQSALDRFAPGVKSADVNNVLGALDRAIPGLGKVVRQNASAGVTAGVNSLGTEAMLEGRKARSFPLKFVDGAVMMGSLKVAQIPPLF